MGAASPIPTTPSSAISTRTLVREAEPPRAMRKTCLRCSSTARWLTDTRFIGRIIIHVATLAILSSDGGPMILRAATFALAAACSVALPAPGLGQALPSAAALPRDAVVLSAVENMYSGPD